MVEYFELTFDLESVTRRFSPDALVSPLQQGRSPRLLLFLDHDEDTNPLKLRRSRRSSAHVGCVALFIFNVFLMVI